jgi:hypothetical protein
MMSVLKKRRCLITDEQIRYLILSIYFAAFREHKIILRNHRKKGKISPS